MEIYNGMERETSGRKTHDGIIISNIKFVSITIINEPTARDKDEQTTAHKNVFGRKIIRHIKLRYDQ